MIHYLLSAVFTAVEILDKTTSAVLLTATASTLIEAGALAWALPAEYCSTYTVRITDLDRPTLIARGHIGRPGPRPSGPGPDQPHYDKPSWCRD